MESKQHCPLVVDFDGTLITTDSLIESLLAVLMQQNRFQLFLLLPLLSDKAKFKQRVAILAMMQADSWPYRQDLLNYLQAEHAKGRAIYLATGADRSIAEHVVNHLAIFSGYFASDGVTNLTGKQKATLLRNTFGEKGYDYIGNHLVDVPIWEGAKAVHFAGPVANLQRQLKSRFKPENIFPDPQFSWKVLIKALRIHQWVKNLLVFVPLIFAHRIFDRMALLEAFQAFLAFSLCASSAYLINDLADLKADRAHPIKRKRPFAAGSLNIVWGMGLAPTLFLAGFAIAITLPTFFLLALLTYYILTYSYSFVLKRLALLDVFTLASLYTLRIFAGAMATSVEISAWLLAFSIFMFFNLAIVKRVSELMMMKTLNKEKPSGRGYRVHDLDVLRMFGVSSAFISVMVLALYINNDKVTILYHKPYLLWLICPILLYWVCRIWLITERGHMHHDPIVFALRDKASYIVGACCAIVGWLAI